MSDPNNVTTILEDLKNADPKVKVEAAKNIVRVAQSLGKERTRNELLPYISGNIEF